MSDIKIANLKKSFGAFEVLRGIDLDIVDGSVLALLGHSGCGKTTLLRLIAGFDGVNDGVIEFGKKVIASRKKMLPPERRGIGYVPQEGALFPHLTVEGNVRFGLSRKNWHKNRVKEVLELTGLEGFGERYPHELSGGQQQRVALARALAPGPKVVLLDEPFNALDLDLRRRMSEDVIRILRQTGTTAVLVTHDPGEAFAVSDKLAVMEAGQLMQSARPEIVYWQPSNAAVARLTGATVFVAGDYNQGWVNSALGQAKIHYSAQQYLPDHTRTDVMVMVRPEQVSWTADVHASRGVPAWVSRRSFRGDHTIVTLNLENLCFDLRMSSLQAPELNAKGRIFIQGACMAYPQPKAAKKPGTAAKPA